MLCQVDRIFPHALSPASAEKKFKIERNNGKLYYYKNSRIKAAGFSPLPSALFKENF